MFALSVMLVTGCTRIDPGYAGLAVNLTGEDRGVDEYIIQTGRVWYNPITTDIISYPTFVQRSVWTKDVNEGSENNEEIVFNDRDGLTISADIAYAYQLKKEMCPAFYVKFRADDILDFTDGYARDLVRIKFNEIAARYSVEEIIEKKDRIITEVRNSVNSQMMGFGIVFENLGYIGALRPPQVIIDRITMKIAATQKAIQLENEVRQKRAEAEKLVVEAGGIADAQVKRAEGEAEANRLVSSSITKTLIEWRNLANIEKQIEAWKAGGAKVPVTYITGGSEGGGNNFIYTLSGAKPTGN